MTIWARFAAWVMVPFGYWGRQRDRDRETLLSALDKIFAAQSRAADVSIEQSRALRSFIDAYMNLTGDPTRRVSTDETEAIAEQESWQLYGES